VPLPNTQVPGIEISMCSIQQRGNEFCWKGRLGASKTQLGPPQPTKATTSRGPTGGISGFRQTLSSFGSHWRARVPSVRSDTEGLTNGDGATRLSNQSARTCNKQNTNSYAWHWVPLRTVQVEKRIQSQPKITSSGNYHSSRGQSQSRFRLVTAKAPRATVRPL